MKKKGAMLLVLMFMMLLGGTVASAHAGHSKPHGLTVLINGVQVQSAANHRWDGKAYVSAAQFAKLFDLEATVSKDRRSIAFNGQTITDIRWHQGEATAWVRELAKAVHAQSVAWDQEQEEVYVLALPKGSVQITPVVPAMGEHWSNPQAGDLPTGPIYGVYNGKLVFLEYMIAQEDFVNGTDHANLAGMKGVPSPSVVQLDIEFQATGHEGFEVPHYDIHAYFITEEEQQKIK
ncbi:hypothetical protein [Paenibacillus spongiae]|uniref:Copper amine oxidase-like N-terminal domain-containing protein n=1 Tax=Paenibacillus spongiae TaxID=2909671 RepID=A0ABY5S6U5_9BACL|nr:hypothetical protein [Paenibacillus spongiae]UVI29213.1 hypothetical protein L1F29_27890 [Paenibacillus spongiae]